MLLKVCKLTTQWEVNTPPVYYNRFRNLRDRELNLEVAIDLVESNHIQDCNLLWKICFRNISTFWMRYFSNILWFKPHFILTLDLGKVTVLWRCIYSVPFSPGELFWARLAVIRSDSWCDFVLSLTLKLKMGFSSAQICSKASLTLSISPSPLHTLTHTRTSLSAIICLDWSLSSPSFETSWSLSGNRWPARSRRRFPESRRPKEKYNVQILFKISVFIVSVHRSNQWPSNKKDWNPVLFACQSSVLSTTPHHRPRDQFLL